MRAFRFSSFGIENLRVETLDPRPLGPLDVRLKMKAVSLNFRDLLMVRGLYNPRQPLPLIPCSDGVGEVVEVGANVKRVKMGDRVSPLFSVGWLSGEPTREKMGSSLGGPIDGTLTEEMVVASHAVVPVPAHMTDEEGATMPCAGVTAWSALVTHGHIEPGQTVLVEGTGGVSIFALQIAQLAGARVIVTSSSDEKLARAKELGAFATINYKKNEAWGKEAKALAGDVGVDHVIEVGGGKTLAEAMKAVRPGGCISIIGVLSGTSADVNLLGLLMQNVRLQGILVGHGESAARLSAAFAAAKVRPVVDKVFAFEDAPKAFEHLASGTHFGKVVIRIA